jgi:dihydroorotase
VSTRGSVRIVREAKARGVKITCETCPHYFTLTEEACKGYNTLAKVNPPLRTEDDRQAILEGIRDGTIDMIVTDHAPHHEDEKQVEFALAANGFIGFESAFPLMNQHLLQAGVITLDRLVELTSVNPAKMFGLESGTLQEGAAADVLIADLDDEWVFDRFATASKAKNAPYHGMTMRGRARWTIVGGDIVHEFIR